MPDKALIQNIVDFALQRWIYTGDDALISDVILVAALWETSPSSFRIPGKTSFHKLYNAYADYKERKYNDLSKNPIG